MSVNWVRDFTGQAMAGELVSGLVSDLGLSDSRHVPFNARLPCK